MILIRRTNTSLNFRKHATARQYPKLGHRSNLHPPPGRQGASKPTSPIGPYSLSPINHTRRISWIGLCFVSGLRYADAAAGLEKKDAALEDHERLWILFIIEVI